MKRIVLILLLATLTSAFSCRQQKSNNASGNMNSKTNANDKMSAGIKDEVPIVGEPGPNTGLSTGNYKSVTINISDDPANPGKCQIEDPGSITLWKKNKEKITWCVINACQSASSGTVAIEDFTQLGDPQKKNPFGDGSRAENTFYISYSDYKCKVKTKEATSGEDGAHYKYSIAIRVGEDMKGMIDPEVVIATME